MKSLIRPWHDLKPGEKVPEEFHSLIEIPLGSNVKYELDKASRLIRVEVEEIGPADTAYPIIQAALERYAKKYSRSRVA